MKRIIALVGTIIFMLVCALAIHVAQSDGAVQAFWLSQVLSPGVFHAHGLHHKLINLSSSDDSLRYGFIDHSGTLKIAATYEDVGDFHNGLAAVSLENKWGFIDRQGKVVIPIKYRSVNNFNEGYAAVLQGYYWNYISNKGTPLIENSKLIYAETFKDGIGQGRAMVDGIPKFVAYNRQGQAIVPHSRGPGEKITGDLIVIKNGGSKVKFDYQFMTRDGVLLSEQKYEDANSHFSEGKIAVCVKEKWGFIDTTGKMIISPSFEAAGPFIKGVAVTRKNGKFGLINGSGRFVLKPKYNDLIGFEQPDTSFDTDNVLYSEGLIPVIDKRQWGFANTKSGKIAIKPNFAEVGIFHQGLAFVGVTKRIFWSSKG